MKSVCILALYLILCVMSSNALQIPTTFCHNRLIVRRMRTNHGAVMRQHSHPNDASDAYLLSEGRSPQVVHIILCFMFCICRCWHV